DPLAAGHGALEHRVLHDQVADGIEEAGNVKGKGRQHGKEVGNVDGARVDRPEAADDDHGRGGDRDGQLEDRHHGGTEEGGLVVGHPVLLVELVEDAAVLVFARHRLDGADAGDALGEVAV